MSKYCNILFDLDGTITDSASGIMNGVLSGVKKINETYNLTINIPSNEILKKFIGPPLQNSFRDICHLDEDMISLAVKTFRGYYTGDNLFNVEIYEGIFELLDYLKSKGIKIAVATYKQESFAHSVRYKS